MTEGRPMSVGSTGVPAQGVIVDSLESPRHPELLAPSERGDSGSIQGDSDLHQNDTLERGDDMGESGASVDRVLEYTTKHGIDEGFDFLAGEEAQVVIANEVKQSQLPDEIASSPSVEAQDPRNDGKETGSPEEITVREEVELLKTRVGELSEGQEEINKELAEVAKQLIDTIQATRDTVLVLYELVKRMHDEAEEKRRKDSLFALLTRLAGFLATSLLSRPEDGEKVLKGEQIK